MHALDHSARIFCLIYFLDRAIKLGTIAHFFNRRRPDLGHPAPSASLIQPVTRGASDLAHNLRSRLQLSYTGKLQHIIVCDAADQESQAVCRNVLSEFPVAYVQLLKVVEPGKRVASKTWKMQQGLVAAKHEVIVFIDDDVALRPGSLDVCLPYLEDESVGAVFGLPCYTNYENVPSSLMSYFVNAAALMSYIPVTYLTEPYTITGQFFALKRAVLDEVGGLDGLESTIADDHALALRLFARGYRAVQTLLIYDISNRFATFSAYAQQMKRWFVIPRQTVFRSLTFRQSLVSGVGSSTSAIPFLLLVVAVLRRSGDAWRCLAACLALAYSIYLWCENTYLKRTSPPGRLPLLVSVILFTPLQIIWSLISCNEIIWRGRRMLVQEGGRYVTE